MTLLIQGSKGGGKGGSSGQSAHVPTEADDTASSRSYAKILDLLAEGEIEGLALPGMQGVYLDGTPIENADGSFNFTGIDFDFRNGTQSQDYIPAFPAVERERVVNVEVIKNQPIIETISDLNIDAIRIKVSTPRLTQQKSNGDIVGYSVTYGIETKANDGSWVRRTTDTMSLKSSGRYVREYAVTLEGTGPWQVRLVRDSADDAKSSISSKTYFSSMTEVILAKLTYPNSVMAGLVVDASQFSSVPVRSYLLKGLRMRVPSNYDPATRIYSGVWDGSFKIAWSCNPAWGLYEILIEERFGLGKHLEDLNLDKWGLYEIGQYCDELVPDGFGGMEPRFELHCYLTTAKQAMRVVNELVSCFASMAFWDGQKVIFSQDRSADPAQRFTNANVKDGKFSYSGSSKTARHTVALVEWVNKDNSYKSEIEYVADNEGIKRYGYNKTSIAAFGCTSRGQANRVGRHLLFTERLETEVISFTAGLVSINSRPGDVIEVADQQKAGQRFGGRVTESSSLSVTVDNPITIVMGETYWLSVALPDGGYDKRLLTNDVGLHDVLTFTETLTDTPVECALWVVSASNLQTSLWRIISAVPNGAQVTINALAHYPQKNDHIELGLVLDPKTTTISAIVKAPVNLVITEQLYESAGRVLNSVEISCDVDITATEYQFSYNRDAGGWVDISAANGPQVTLYDMQPGSFQVRAKIKNGLGNKSVYSYALAEVLGKTAPPGNVSNLLGRVVDNQFVLSWDTAADLDVLIGGRVVIRHSLLADSWDAAVALGESISGADTSVSLPLLNGVYLAKFIDSSGKESLNAVSVISNVAGVLDRNVVAQVKHGQDFPGQMVGFIYDINQQALSVDNLRLFDELSDQVDDWLDWDGEGGYLGSAIYELQGPDLGAVFSARIAVDLEMQISRILGADPAVTIEQTANVTLDISQTDDDPNGNSPLWTPWQRFSIADYTARATRYRIIYQSGDENNVIKISGISVNVDMSDQIETQSDLLATVDGLSIEYLHNFYDENVFPGITANNMQTGDYFELSATTKNGFTIQFFNASEQPVARRFNYLVKSY